MEAEIIQIACGPVLERRRRWTLHLLEKQVLLELDAPVGRETIRRVLKKQTLPYMNEHWRIPQKENPNFIAHMEDMLDVQEKPYDAKPL